MTLETYFRATSYATVACGALALAMSGGVPIGFGVAFAALLILCWNLERPSRQLSERVGLVIVLLSLPLFYLDWKYVGAGSVERGEAGVGALGHLIIFLSAVKLLQVKANRDWVFLYIISFFQVLLAAGLGTSPLLLVALGLYTLCAVSTIVTFEMRKGATYFELVEPAATLNSLMQPPDRQKRSERFFSGSQARGIPWVAFVLMALIVLLGVPIFLAAPRYGASVFAHPGEGLSGIVGFSDDVNLGSIGLLQREGGVVMRVRIEDSASKKRRNLRWRGIALDEFTGKGWRRSRPADSFIQLNNERNFFPLGTTEDLHRLMLQTFFLEPIDTPILFAAPRVVAIQGALPYVRGDEQGAIQTRHHEADRISYKAYSDIVEPGEDVLRRDSASYPRSLERFLQLPSNLDPRINSLATQIASRANSGNRYDIARAIESHLQSEDNYRYTLDLSAGGNDPLADFLFRVREGHCEYFATAMAVMLRTQGIASRIVNGFQMGEYNDAADVFTVRQSDAHSWVEVYFPESGSWVTFDPTPLVGRPVRESVGFKAGLAKYAEALELFWMQHIVGYDKQEQRSLVSSLGNGTATLGHHFADLTENSKQLVLWLTRIIMQSTKDAAHSWILSSVALALLTLIVLSMVIFRRLRRMGLLSFGRSDDPRRERFPVIGFYRRMIEILEARGIMRPPDLTPLEFAMAAGTPGALEITEAYNRVRYGDQPLSKSEEADIEHLLRRLEQEVAERS